MKAPKQDTEITNRIKKRWKHLKKWVNTHAIGYFRLFDRDVPNVPLIIDVLPNQYVIWVCNHSLSEHELAQKIEEATAGLVEIQEKPVLIKCRQKNKAVQASGWDTSKDKRVVVSEFGLKFELNLSRYLDTGLFIDHRLTRQWVYQNAKGKRVLNLFSYTGSFSCYAQKGGALWVTSVDLNPVYSQWHQRNCELNQIDSGQYQIVTADVMTYLKNHQSKYDLIICDPPSFSHSKRKGASVFQIQSDAPSLIQRCLQRLRPNGVLLFSNNYKKFNMTAIQNNISADVVEKTTAFTSKDFVGKHQSRTWLMSKVV